MSTHESVTEEGAVALVRGREAEGEAVLAPRWHVACAAVSCEPEPLGGQGCAGHLISPDLVEPAAAGRHVSSVTGEVPCSRPCGLGLSLVNTRHARPDSTDQTV